MKRNTVVVLTLLVLAAPFVFYKPAHAATYDITAGSNGPGCSDGGYFTPNAKTINAGDSIKFSVPANDPYSAGLEIHNFPGGNFTILPGQSHTTPALVVSVSYYATWPSSGCQKGTGNITVQTPAPDPSPPPAQAALPPATAPTSPTPVPPPPPNKPPDILKIDKAMVDGEKIDTAKNITIDVSKSITLSGYTIANGAVNLTIHSAVRNEIARANASGFWTLTVSDLEPGTHTIDATVTDLTTHLSSQSATLLKFAVTGKKAAALVNKSSTISVKPSKNSPVLLIVIGMALAAGIGAVVFWYINKRNKPKKSKEVMPTQAPPPTEIAPTV
jgi:hypothetical protein